jgi:hypothetical protein
LCDDKLIDLDFFRSGSKWENDLPSNFNEESKERRLVSTSVSFVSPWLLELRLYLTPSEEVCLNEELNRLVLLSPLLLLASPSFDVTMSGSSSQLVKVRRLGLCFGADLPTLLPPPEDGLLSSDGLVKDKFLLALSDLSAELRLG